MLKELAKFDKLTESCRYKDDQAYQKAERKKIRNKLEKDMKPLEQTLRPSLVKKSKSRPGRTSREHQTLGILMLCFGCKAGVSTTELEAGMFVTNPGDIELSTVAFRFDNGGYSARRYQQDIHRYNYIRALLDMGSGDSLYSLIRPILMQHA